MQRRKMDRWRVGVSLLFALVLCLGMFGVAVADPPGGNPACEKEDPPPNCEDGHPGNGEGEGEDDQDDDNGDDGGEGEANPLAPLGEVCSQVVQAIAGNDPSGQAIQLHALCEALGAEPLDDGGGDEPPDGEEESPTQAFADACNEFIDQLVANGAPSDVEQGRQLCAQFGEAPGGDDGGDDGGDEGSQTQALADACNEFITQLVANGAPSDVEQGRQLCDQFGERPDGGEEPPSDGDGASPTQPLADACNELITQLVANGAPAQLEEARALCDQFGERPGDGGEEPPSDDEGSQTQAIADACNEFISQLVANGAPGEVEQGRELCAQFGEGPDGGEEPPSDDEGSQTQPIADACNEFVSQLVDNGAPAEAEQARQLCDQFGERPDDGGGDEPPSGGGESPLAPFKDGCGQVVGALSGLDEAFGQGQALCDALP